MADQYNQSSVTGGGLATSSNVPRPGTSINPATGQPNTAGLTREQLAAKRAAEAGGAGGMSFLRD